MGFSILVQRLSFFAVIGALCMLAGCIPPSDHLTFPSTPLRQTAHETWYDVASANGHGSGKPDFAIHTDDSGRVTELWYDDQGAGKPDRIYRLSDYNNKDVPHLIILLDSIPYQSAVDYWDKGGFRFCDRPQKVIAPFPSLTEVCYSRVLHAPPLPGAIDESYDSETGKIRTSFMDRVNGYEEPWERRLAYQATFYEDGLSYLNPRPWNLAQMSRAHQTFNDSPDRVTVVYIPAASSMVCRLGAVGVKETLDEAQRWCLQILYERRGAVKISMMADHGHNLMESINFSIEDLLKAQGFHSTDRLHDPNDIVMEVNGLVTYDGVRTTQPAKVAAILSADKRIELTMYREGDRVIVRDAGGTASVEYRDGMFRYRPVEHDVLGYQPAIDALTARGKASADGYIHDRDWFEATLDHQFPDGPRRVWDAFHGIVVDPPDVMITIRDGYCCGLDAFTRMVSMASTHGGLNQVNSATFLMSMTGRVTHPLRSDEVLQTLEPGFEPKVLR